jgi:hypothetical protein
MTQNANILSIFSRKYFKNFNTDHWLHKNRPRRSPTAKKKQNKIAVIFWGQQPLVPLLPLGPPFSLEWPASPCTCNSLLAVSLKQNNWIFLLRIKLHALIRLGVSPPSCHHLWFQQLEKGVPQSLRNAITKVETFYLITQFCRRLHPVSNFVGRLFCLQLIGCWKRPRTVSCRK